VLRHGGNGVLAGHLRTAQHTAHAVSHV
jgi:hypothetical protein